MMEETKGKLESKKELFSRNKLSMCKDEVIDSSSFFMYTYKFVPLFSLSYMKLN